MDLSCRADRVREQANHRKNNPSHQFTRRFQSTQFQSTQFQSTQLQSTQLDAFITFSASGQR